jgi:hypothetical protein
VGKLTQSDIAHRFQTLGKAKVLQVSSDWLIDYFRTTNQGKQSFTKKIDVG